MPRKNCSAGHPQGRRESRRLEKYFATQVRPNRDLHADFRACLPVLILHALPLKPSRIDWIELQLEQRENRTVDKIVYSGVTVKPETQFMCWKIMGQGERI
jgi:hypothetical protein